MPLRGLRAAALQRELKMTVLIAEESGKSLNLSTRERLHWIVGRGEDCDLVLNDPGVSRYHCTVFRVHEEYCLLDHSLNGTHLCGEAEKPSGHTRLPTLPPLPKLSDLNTKPRVNRREMEETATFAPIADSEEEEERVQRERTYHDLHKSHAEFKLQEINSRLPRMIGYEPHLLKAPVDMQPLLRMVYSAEGVDALVSMGRILSPDLQVILIGRKRHVLKLG
jgi:hypothetical protein